MNDQLAVTVYGKPLCQQCKATTRKLDQYSIEYTYIDVTEDRDAYNYVIGLGYQQVPVVVLSDDSSWSGYRPGRIRDIHQGG